MDKKQTVAQSCLDQLEEALLEYVEKYGPTDKAKRAIRLRAISRADCRNDLS
mgnify:CR=1 FL=1